MSAGKEILGVLAGVAAGALLGVLFAPDKGSVTRKNVTKKGEDYAEDLKNKFNDFLGSITERFEEVEEEGKDLVNKGKEYVEKGKAKFDEAKKDVKSGSYEKYSPQS